MSKLLVKNNEKCPVWYKGLAKINEKVKFEQRLLFLDLGGQGMAWVTDLHWLTAGVGTASNKTNTM